MMAMILRLSQDQMVPFLTGERKSGSHMCRCVEPHNHLFHLMTRHILTVPVIFRFFIYHVSGCCTAEEEISCAPAIFMKAFSESASAVNARLASRRKLNLIMTVRRMARSGGAYTSQCVANDFH